MKQSDALEKNIKLDMNSLGKDKIRIIARALKQYLKIIYLISAGMLLSRLVFPQHVVSIANEEFEKFNNVQGGWCASDATISLLLPDGKTLWLFGDTFIGKKDGNYKIIVSTSNFINNSAIIDDGTTLITYHGGTAEKPASLIPGIDSIKGDLFWPEHATFENDTIKIFAIHILHEDNGTPGFNFRVGRTHLASFKYPEMKFIGIKLVENITDTSMRFGTHVLQRKDHKYIFGKKDTLVNGLKYPIPMLARVDSSVSEPWKFYAGNDTWSLNCDDAVSIGDRPMSESFFVFEKNDKFYLIMHEIWLIPKLYILESNKITGPWNRASSGGIENWFCVLPKHGDNFTYNLFAHPQFQNTDSLLISFNVNTSDFNSIYNNTRNYRGRFLWLSVEDAVITSIPDTVYIFDDFTNIREIDYNKQVENHYFKSFTDKLVIKNINSPAILSIYSIDGKLLYYRDIETNITINLNDFSNTILIFKLFNKHGVYTKKVQHSF